MKRGAKGIGSVAKRRREEERKEVENASFFDQNMFSAESVQKFQKEYTECKPFKHILIQNVCNPETLKGALDQALENMKADLRESDCFKVYQTKNFQDVDDNELQTIKKIMALKQTIYGEEFLRSVQEITGSAALSDKVDFSAYILNEGCHILPNNEMWLTGSRAIGFLLFMTPESEEWGESDGGFLELYPQSEQGGADCIPTKLIAPKWNSMLLFEAGHFFGFQEVCVPDKTLLCLAGWFHRSSDSQDGRKEAPPGTEDALVGAGEFLKHSSDSKINEEEKEFLSQYVNPKYLDEEVISQISSQFEEDSFVELKDFLVANELKAIKHVKYLFQLDNSIDKENKRVSYTEGADESAKLLMDLKMKLFASDAFAKLVSAFTGSTGVRRKQQNNGSSAVASEDREMCQSKSDMWQSSLIGGYASFVAKDDYKPYIIYEGGASQKGESKSEEEQDDEPFAQATACNNSLFIALRDEGVSNFVKFVSGLAPGSRFDVTYEAKMRYHDE
ncbi:hypothetical protein GUITHDRAFT_107504 [Guillardia theta CCMP2712]|uniref:Uncharacterized protein n=1 Tax=Guillardia theta (strain CCMP2712) TaxID=905079 RepID=L1JEJ5_GUITC|nr:hypothetical protein GUITHDRAFT_107504 [Guillardia theta CCMP2712]EKX46727.1 hypothetical protein GUITHDRAFT_107504 [Guillardia theta CCMP2712]|eukprot:XP_005833707.1 hypothetical protein GUITHDRAFT_107504 [Guillardia theta CCMP2712]